jgi:hypothetical protein
MNTAQKSVQSEAVRAAASVQVDLTEDAAKFLRDTLNSGDDEPPEITLAVTHGHSGYGLYQWETEYPDEGSNLLQAIALPTSANPDITTYMASLARENEELRAANAKLVDALEGMEIAACGAAVIHPGERALLREAVFAARAALAGAKP